MASETDFLNEALTLIGQKPIVAIDDGSTNANVCARLYPQRRKAALRVHDWNFAQHTAELAQDLNALAIGWAFGFSLPADFIKLRTYYGGGVSGASSLFSPYYSGYNGNVKYDPQYEIKGADLYSNDGTVVIDYTRDITDPNKWDSLFWDMLVNWVASRLAMAITRDVNRSNELLQQALVLGLPLAAAVDSQEQSTRPYTVDDLTWGR